MVTLRARAFDRHIRRSRHYRPADCLHDAGAVLYKHSYGRA